MAHQAQAGGLHIEARCHPHRIAAPQQPGGGELGNHAPALRIALVDQHPVADRPQRTAGERQRIGYPEQ